MFQNYFNISSHLLRGNIKTREYNLPFGFFKKFWCRAFLSCGSLWYDLNHIIMFQQHFMTYCMWENSINIKSRGFLICLHNKSFVKNNQESHFNCNNVSQVKEKATKETSNRFSFPILHFYHFLHIRQMRLHQIIAFNKPSNRKREVIKAFHVSPISFNSFVTKQQTKKVFLF